MTDLEKAYELFVERATRQGNNWFSDLVKENLSRLLASGLTPEQAVTTLFNQASRRKRRR